MRVTEMTSQASERLRGAMGAAISLWMVQLLCDLAFSLAGYAVTLLLNTTLYRVTPNAAIVTGSAGTLLALTLIVCLSFPMRLSQKRWFFRMGEGILPVNTAFSCFLSMREYLSALTFSFVRFGASVGIFLLLQLPALFLFSLLRVQYLQSGGDVGVSFAVFAILAGVLSVLALFASVYLRIGIFLADYLYAAGQTKRPIPALRQSLVWMRGRRREFLAFCCLQAPYLLGCLLLLPLPFCVASMRSAFAYYAKEVFSEIQTASSEETIS